MRVTLTVILLALVSSQTWASIDVLKRTRIKPSIVEDPHAILPIITTRSLGTGSSFADPRVKVFPWEDLERLEKLFEQGVYFTLSEFWRYLELLSRSLFAATSSKPPEKTEQKQRPSHTLVVPGIRSLPQEGEKKETKATPLLPPPKRLSKLTVVLDLDETLVWNRDPDLNSPALPNLFKSVQL